MKQKFTEVVEAFTQEHWDAILKYADEVGVCCDYVCSDSYKNYTNHSCLNFNKGDSLSYGSREFYIKSLDTHPITFEEFSKEYLGVSEIAADTNITESVNSVNPKAQIGSYALPMGMISPLFSAHVALGKLNGGMKYGIANYIGTEVVMSIYLDAIQRHLDKIKMGEEVDEVDGVNHFGAIGANCDIILSAQAAGTLIDDRPLSIGQLEAYKALTPMVKQLKELHKEKQPKHYYAKDSK